MTNALAEAAKQSGLVASTSGSIVEGIDNVDDRDLKIGSVVLVQDALKVFTRKGIKPGAFANTATEAEISNISFIPCFMQKRWFLVDNSETIPKTLGSSVNENDPMFNGKLRLGSLTKEQKESKIKPEVYPGFVTIALVNGLPMKIKFWKAAAYYAGQDLYNYAREDAQNSKLPLWGRKYALSSKLVPPSKGNPDYYAMVITRGDLTTDEEKAIAGQLYQSFKTKVQPVEAAEDTVPF